jgi:hypothetical protein
MNGGVKASSDFSCGAHTHKKKYQYFPMDHNRSWKILNWNLRGINSEKKWVALSSKIDESNCDIICLQETKRESFDMEYIRNSVRKDLINLNSSLQLDLLGVLLPSGVVLCSLALWLFRMSSPSLFSSPVILQIVLGF